MDLFGLFRSFFSDPLHGLIDGDWDGFTDLLSLPIVSGHSGRGQPSLPLHRSAGGLAHRRWRKRRAAGRV